MGWAVPSCEKLRISRIAGAPLLVRVKDELRRLALPGRRVKPDVILRQRFRVSAQQGRRHKNAGGHPYEYGFHGVPLPA